MSKRIKTIGFSRAPSFGFSPVAARVSKRGKGTVGRGGESPFSAVFLRLRHCSG